MNALKVCPQCGTEYPANARFCEIDGTALRSAGGDTDLVGTIVADRYVILKKLGEGGMGQVYLAEHVKMGRKSALKVMHPGMVKDVDSISRFNREAANASRISHPNVAAVYDFGETKEGLIYLAMEFVDGPPLTRVIEQAGSLPPKRAAEIVRQIGEALAVAHDMGIVHRDLKPDNVMIAKTRDGGDLVKVVDFGIAKAAGNEAQKVTKTGLVVGTPEYMSPEQLAGDKLDGRSDIYSLGLLAFNMLTSKLPFPSDSAQESMIMRLTDKPKQLSDMRPEISWPADVQRVMDKVLERDAAERYQLATAFSLDFYRAIDRMPETLAAELGTQMIPVPATRVSESVKRDWTPPVEGVAPAGGEELLVPAPIASPAVTHAAAKSKKMSIVAIASGVGVVVVAAVAVPLMMKAAKADSTKTTQEAQTPKTQVPAATDPQTPLGAPKTAPNGAQPVQEFKKTGGSTQSPPAGTPGSRLATLETEVQDTTKADNVLRELADLLPLLKRSNDELARGNYVGYYAALAKNDGTKACTYLAEAARVTTDPAAKRKYDRLVQDNSCP